MYIPFRQGDVFRPTQKTKIALEQCFNPFGTGQCLTTVLDLFPAKEGQLSQSLWNRAVSYDEVLNQIYPGLNSLNPFGTGQCLTTEELRQLAEKANSLNPFGTGQCLTTENGELRLISLPFVSIPLEQGSVLRLAGKLPAGVDRVTSQSLWNRAVSYDINGSASRNR